MKKMKTFMFTFADGFVTICYGMSAAERKSMERIHGKLIKKEAV